MGKLDSMKAAASLGGRSNAFPPGIDPSQAVGRPRRLEGARGDRSAMSIEVSRIVRDPDQPRTEFDPDELDRLTRSVARDGVLQPIRVRWDEGQGAYVVLLGERRWRAATAAGLREIPCIVHDGTLDPTEKLGLQLIENALRHDLKPIEQANAYRRLMDTRGWNAKEIAAELNISPSSMTRALSLLELPPIVQDRVEQGALSPSAAAEIAKLDRPEDQIAVARAAEAEDFGRDEVAQVVKAVKARRAPAARPAKPEPFVFEGADFTLTIKWKKAGGPPALKALSEATKYARAIEAEARSAGHEADAA